MKNKWLWEVYKNIVLVNHEALEDDNHMWSSEGLSLNISLCQISLEINLVQQIKISWFS